MPWLQIGQTLLIPWVLITLYCIFAPNKIRSSYQSNEYYTPEWRYVVIGINLLVVAGALLYIPLAAIWGF